MVGISIETIGDERFIRGFNRYVGEIQDFTVPFRQIVQAFWRVNKKNFKAQGIPEGFTPLSPKYKAWKDKHYPGKPILQLTGRLMESLTGENQADQQDTIVDIQKKRAEFGTGVPYANRQYHSGRKGVQLTDGTKQYWGTIIQSWAYQILKESLG